MMYFNQLINVMSFGKGSTKVWRNLYIVYYAMSVYTVITLSTLHETFSL